MNVLLETRPSPEDGDVEIVASCNVWGFDVVTEKDEGDEKVVDVRLVHRQEDQRSVVLKHRNRTYATCNLKPT